MKLFLKHRTAKRITALRSLIQDWLLSLMIQWCQRSLSKELLGIRSSATQNTQMSSTTLVPTSKEEKIWSKMETTMKAMTANSQTLLWFFLICHAFLMTLPKDSISNQDFKKNSFPTWRNSKKLSSERMVLNGNTLMTLWSPTTSNSKRRSRSCKTPLKRITLERQSRKMAHTRI